MKALSDPGRAGIVMMLTKRELCACEMVPRLGLGQSPEAAALMEGLGPDNPCCTKNAEHRAQPAHGCHPNGAEPE